MNSSFRYIAVRLARLRGAGARDLPQQAKQPFRRMAAALAVLAAGLAGAVAPAQSASAAQPQATGYWVVSSRGSVLPVGGIPNLSPSFSVAPSTPAVAIASTPDGAGYWIVTAAGNVFNFGDAGWFGSPAARGGLNGTVTGLTPTPDGHGYWIVTAAGNVFNFGDAGWWGSPAAESVHLPPVVGIASAAGGTGYYVLTQAGNVITFGNAPWYGSPASLSPGRIVAISADPATGGYWVASSTGGIFSYHSPFHGSLGASTIPAPITGMQAIQDGSGYRLVGSDGSVYDFGSATYFGSAVGKSLGGPIVGIAPSTELGATIRYPAGANGFDVSWPQCGGPLPGGPHTIAIVGVNNGLTYTLNNCLGSEAAWAGTGLNLYINLNQPAWANVVVGEHGPAGNCSLSDAQCLSYNFGYNAATWSVQQAANQHIHAPMWWLDVELVSSEPSYWSSNQAANAQVIQGAIDALHAQGLLAGIYSTYSQWTAISGNFHPNVPVWYPTGYNLTGPGSTNPSWWCANANSFAGQVWLIQGASGAYDGNYSC
ncbi:MAG: hypothetical protein M0Z87_11400 [Actinomycetota bacterium]|nr:hypothetical protein [Actinomycetota bacterium]